jgi:hypothetical protein
MSQQILTNTDTTSDQGIDIKTILDPLQVDRSVKHNAWNAYHGAKTPEEFKKSFDSLNLPKDVKHDLWNAKYAPDKYQEEQNAKPKKSTAEISAIHPPKSIGEWTSRFALQFGQDLRFGSGMTKAGQVYKKLGGQPFYAGNGGAAEFIMSLPLGILKALEGVGDITQGKVWQGTKKVISGGMQAAEEPLSFMSPEVGETSVKGAVKTTEKVGEITEETYKGIKQLLNPKSSTLPITTAPRELKMGEIVQKIVSDNVSNVSGKLSQAQDELDYIAGVIKINGKADKTLINAYQEAANKLKEAQELHKEVNKFSNILGNESPEKIVTKLINGTKADQSYVKSVTSHMMENPKAIKNLQDTTLRGIIEKYTQNSFAVGKKTDWIKVQQDLFQKGDMAKDLLSSRYYPVLQEVNKLAKQQRIGKAVIYSIPTLSILGLTRAWYLRHAMKVITQ